MSSIKFLFSLICAWPLQLLWAQLPSLNETLPEVTAPQQETRKKTVTVFAKDGSYGLQKEGAVLLPAVYQEIAAVTAAVLQLKQHDKYGVADKNGNIVIAVEFDSIKNNFVGNEALVVYKNGKAGVRNTSGEELLPLQYDAVLYSNAASKYSLVKKGGRHYLLYGKEEVNLQYQRLTFYNNLVVIKQHGKYGVLTTGRSITGAYDSMYVAQQKSYQAVTGSYTFSDYRIAATTLFTMQNNRYGLVQSDGTEIIAPEYDNIQYDHYRKVYHIKKNSLTGLYLEATKKRTAVEFEHVYSDGMRYITVKKNGRYGIINYQLTQVLPCEYDKIDMLGASGSFRVTQNGKTGLFTETGKPMIPILYDTIADFSLAQKLRGLYKISLNNRYGIVNSAGKTIVPPVYEQILEKNNFLMVTGGKKYGLYTKDGKQVCDTVYNRFEQSATRFSRILFSYKDSLKGIIKEDGKVLYEPIFRTTGYITNTEGLLNPFSTNQSMYLYVRSNDNKTGVFDEKAAAMVVPVVYDSICQKFETAGSTYFSVKKDTKFGVINDKDSIVVPFEYDFIDMSGANANTWEEAQLVVKKEGLYGAVSLTNKILLPIKYLALVKLSDDNFYKARLADGQPNQVMLLDGRNTTVSKGPFDDIGMFEGNVALSFYRGNMRLINKSGALISEEIPMEPPVGYTTFEALKQALINALNSSDNKDLEIFAYKTAPSFHSLYFIKGNVLTGEPLGYVMPEGIRKKYFQDLLLFKRTKWVTGLYKKSKLTEVDDYTFSDEGLFTNKRLEETAFGDTGFLEKFLRDAVRVNGYWISSYFMNRNFYTP